MNRDRERGSSWPPPAGQVFFQHVPYGLPAHIFIAVHEHGDEQGGFPPALQVDQGGAAEESVQLVRRQIEQARW